MGKLFFEVFPTLKFNNNIHDIMEQTEVEKISATKRKDFLRIYLYSTRLIAKEAIWTVENEIKKQLFPSANMTIKIYERFALSSQYNPEKLIDIYRDSILAELREYSHIEYNAFKTAKIAYPSEDKMVLTVEDSVLVRSKEDELVRVLEKVLVERCGFSVAIKVEYREAEENALREDEEQKIQMKVSEIYRRVKGNAPESGGDYAYGEAGDGGEAKGAQAAGGGTAEAFGGAVAGGLAKNSAPSGSAGTGGSTGSFQAGAVRKNEFKRSEFKKGDFR